MKSATTRFLDYITYDTGSEAASETFPSTGGQIVFAEHLVEELHSIGLKDAQADRFGYVYATLPANTEKTTHSVCFIAHMDTVNDPSSKNIHPHFIYGYKGEDIVLNEKKQIILSPKEYPNLKTYIGQDMIVTDGTTILGGDDKAGIAAIITGVEKVIISGKAHGTCKIVFTPDEEIGRGTDHINIEKINADYAYTLDGGKLGDYQYESFNIAELEITVRGKMCHLGRGKARGLVNSIKIGMELQTMLPAFEDPANTEKHEGFYHISRFSGNVSESKISYQIREHDTMKFERMITLFEEAVAFLNLKYGKNTLQYTIQRKARNMYDVLKDKMHILNLFKTSMEELGVSPNARPVRGSTDGAKLSFMGLPCPNICMGAENAHSIYEYTSVQSLEGVSDMVCKMIQNTVNII